MVFNECVRDLDKLYLVKLGYGGSNGFRLKPMFATAPAAALNNDACFKSGQKGLENNHLDLYV